MTRGIAIFETNIGPCAIAWGEQGILGSQLPERDAAATLARLHQRFPQLLEALPPAEVAAVLAEVQALLRGEQVDLSSVRLDMTGVPEFHQRIYALVRQLQPGQTTTYGELARQVGEPGAARAVGQAMGSNRFAPIVPCHRVLAANGATGGFSARGGVHTKLQMLAIERAAPNGQPSLF